MSKIKNWSRDYGKPTDMEGWRKGKDGYLMDEDDVAWSHDMHPRYRAYITSKKDAVNYTDDWAFIVTSDGNTIKRSSAPTKQAARQMAVRWMKRNPNP